MFGVTRVTNGFNSKKLCDRRRYKYVLPEWAFAPPGAAAADAAAFRLGDDGLARLNGLLARFVGTHNFHNYTVRVSADAAAARRYILSFAATPPAEVAGARLVTLHVLGQSFMLHQIRKMVGTALAVMRGALPEEHLGRALAAKEHVVRALRPACVCVHAARAAWLARPDTRSGSVQRVCSCSSVLCSAAFLWRCAQSTPMAPELGLYLAECIFHAYNERWKARAALRARPCIARSLITLTRSVALCSDEACAFCIAAHRSGHACAAVARCV